MQKVVVTDSTFESLDVERGVLEPLGCEVVGAQCKTQDELIDLTQQADYVITQFARVDAAVIAAMEKCRIIVRYGVGVDNVDLDAAAERNIPVCNVPGYCVNEVADHTLALVLALTRWAAPCWDDIRQGRWKLPVALEHMRALKDMTVGVVGFGRIGAAVAARLIPFRCRILVCDPAVHRSVIVGARCEPVGLDELLEAADLISLHCPSTPQTQSLIDESTIRKMKRGVLLVNTSRGDVVETDHLIAALDRGHVAGAALDVTSPEPIPHDSPLLKMQNVIITPHIASVSVAAITTLRTSAAEAVACAVRGDKLPNVVNGVDA